MATAPTTKFLKPEVLRQLAHIELRARLLVEGMYASRHRCPYYGYSVEFKDHREYVPGDDPRNIDWKTLARTERYYVKRFEMESSLFQASCDRQNNQYDSLCVALPLLLLSVGKLYLHDVQH